MFVCSLGSLAIAIIRRQQFVDILYNILCCKVVLTAICLKTRYLP